MSECEIGDYVLYADAQAREAALVEALRLFVEEWDDLMMNQLASCYEYADALLAEYDAEKGFKSRIFAMLGGFLAEYDAEKGGAK